MTKNNMEQSNNVVVVTGATSGFGRSMVEKFANLGFNIVAIGRREDRLEKLSKAFGDNLHPLPLDVRDTEKVFYEIDKLPSTFSKISILINNAGLALGLNPAHNADWKEWETMIDTNVKGLSAVTRAILPGMVQRNHGHIINIGSVAGSYPYPGGNVYGGTKAFVRQFSLNLRADLIGTKIRVTSLEPGMANTEFSLVRLQNQDKADAVYQGVTPLSADDVADMAIYICSLPQHININVVEVMPTGQSFDGFKIHRENKKDR